MLKNVSFIVVITAVCSSQPQELKLELGIKLPGAQYRQLHARAAPAQIARSVTRLYLSVVLVQGVQTNVSGSWEKCNATPT
jgi:hypothetical protein